MTNTETGAQAAPAQFIPRAQLRVEPRLNTRIYFRKLDELAASLKEHGQIEPLVVRRPWPDADVFEVGAGARRLLAAEIAGIDQLLCVVRELSDRQMIEMSIVENKDRDDLHPLEEGEAYRRLHFGWRELGLDAAVPIDELAARSHRSRAYVYGRIRLCVDLCDDAKKLFGEWRIDTSGALALLKITNKERQAKALAELLEHRAPDYVLKSDEIEQYVRRRFLLSLVEARFPKKDEQLVPEAGACTTCPKRSGNQPELFDAGGERKDDLCTDPECFGWKKDAYVKRVLDGGAAPVLDPKEVKQIFKGGTTMAHDSPWVVLDSPCYEDSKQRSYKSLLGKELPAVTIALDPEGWPRQVIRREDAVKLLRTAGHPFASEVEANGAAGKSQVAAQSADRDARKRADAAARRRAVDVSLIALESAAAKKKPSRKALQLLAKGVLAITWADTKSEYVKRHGLDDAGAKGSKKERVDKLLLARVQAMSEEELLGFLFEIVVSRDAYQAADAGKDARRTTIFFETLEAFGVDFDAFVTIAKKQGKEQLPKAVAKATIKIPGASSTSTAKAGKKPEKPAKKAAAPASAKKRAKR